MSADPEDLDRLIASVVDGQDVDWAAARSGRDDRERKLLEQLRLLAVLGEAASDAEVPVDTGSTLRTGERWGSLELLAPLGRGAFGEVWRARDVHLDREVALKFLFDRSGAGMAQDGSAVLHEGRLLSRVRHPNVVTVHGADRVDGRIGVWMECVDGRTLDDLVRASGPFGAEDAIQVGVDICRGLSALHAAGLVHRDVKAQNVMREDGGRTVLMDLGVGIDTGRPREHEGSAGTPLYLAPEIFAGEEASPRSDMYSLGVLLFHLVTGDYPVRGSTRSALTEAHRRQDSLSLGDLRPDLPERFIAVVRLAMDPDPQRRFENTAAMERALLESSEVAGSGATSTSPRTRHEWRRAVLMGGLAALLVLTAWWWAVPALPPGTAAGAAFDRQDTVLIAAFDNHSGDRSLDGALERALSHELSQSPHVAVASTRRRDDLLRLMGWTPETAIDRSVAREMALRDGNIRLVLAGTVERPGSTYVFTVEALAPVDGARVHSLQETAESPADIVSAIRRLATRLRSALGEDKANVDVARRQLEKVTTPSLQALRLYSEAYDAGNRGLWAQSESLVRSALDLEPDFASALNWLGWSVFNKERPREVWMPYFERAFRLSETTPDRERYFIAGSYFGHIGDDDRAIAAFNALVRLYPDHAWGLNNLIVWLDRVGRRLEISDLLAELAQVRPDDIELVVRAGLETLATKGIEASRPYVRQAKSLSGPVRRGPGMAFHSLWLELFDAHEHWLAGRPEDATRQLEAAMDSRAAGQVSPDVRSNVVGYFNLALGRTGAAAAAFQRISNPALRSTALGTVALARGQPSEVSRQLGAYGGRDALSVLLLMKAGNRAAAKEVLNHILQRVGPQPGEPRWDAIQVEVEATLPASARLASLTRVEALPIGWDTARYYLHVETLASLLQESGSPDAALAVLERAASYRDRAHRDPVHIGYFWMRVQKRLADAYRAAGRPSKAEPIEADLLRVLAAADPDFPLLLELRARSLAADRR